MKNKLPDYRWAACETLDSKAFDKHYDRKKSMNTYSSSYSSPYGTSASSYEEKEPSYNKYWKCRFWKITSKTTTYWSQCLKSKNQWDEQEPHCSNWLRSTSYSCLCTKCEKESRIKVIFNFHFCLLDLMLKVVTNRKEIQADGNVDIAKHTVCHQDIVQNVSFLRSSPLIFV